jgi:hypothetical protein
MLKCADECSYVPAYASEKGVVKGAVSKGEARFQPCFVGKALKAADAAGSTVPLGNTRKAPPLVHPIDSDRAVARGAATLGLRRAPMPLAK